MGRNIESKKVKVGDLDIHYLTGGQGDPLIVIHGGGGSSSSWRKNLKELTRNYFMVKTNKGLVCDIYRDMPDGNWYLSRIHE